MSTRHFVIATAGHVDHGKSALVKALTGTDPDRLPEEKARKITIELGFAELNLTAPNGQTIHAGIIDVPGHEDFVRNMIAGVGSIDLALFVVAADDGWMRQTEEHLQILMYLGVKRAVVALAKSDLRKIDSVTDGIRIQMCQTVFARSPIVPTSVRTGAGIENLKGAIASELAAMHPQRDFGKPRLFIDRAFTLRGIGTVVTGTLSGGSIRRSQDVVVQPGEISARVRSIQNHGRDIEIARPGMRTAINLPDLSIGENGMQRGDLITVPGLGSPHATIDVLLERSSRLKRNSPPARPIKNGSSIQVHFGTGRIAAKITLLDKPALGAGQNAIGRLQLDSPIVAFVGDRFVLRDSSEQNTIAGGTVLDPDADRANFRSNAQIRFLRARATAPHDIDVCVRSEIALREFVLRKALLNKSPFSDGEISEALARLQCAGEIVLCSEIATDRKTWQQLRERASSLIDEVHKCNPERAGLDLNELRSTLRIQESNVFEALIADLCVKDFVRKGSAIARISHRPLLPADLEPVERSIRESLSHKPFDPLPRREIEPDRRAQHVLRFLIDSGQVIEVGPDAVLLRDNFEHMKARITEFISKHGPATVSELRQALESSRRIMVPLLERLDRDGVTRRV
ncbi:MAG TPA: selenocysteine-specific translation elongation factor, partial [Candidatus Acidoferrum sp.]|nr:selenocysteine-specific translation elongation factor [Candidatus Acidoferrum sp.]